MMILESILNWIYENQTLALGIAIVISYGLFLLSRLMISRLIPAIAQRTENLYDDVIVEQLHPFRFAWLIPLVFLYIFADSVLGPESELKNIFLVLIIGMVVYALILALNGLNEVYEMRPSYSGVSIKGYLDLVKLLFILVGIIITISILTGESPVGLLSGLGALTAVLLLIFRDTILSLVASIQIASNDLIKEGDWIEVPS